MGESPGLMLMEDNSCLRGCEFESWCHILDRDNTFPHWLVVTIILFDFKYDNEWKRGFELQTTGIGIEPYTKNVQTLKVFS